MSNQLAVANGHPRFLALFLLLVSEEKFALPCIRVESTLFDGSAGGVPPEHNDAVPKILLAHDG